MAEQDPKRSRLRERYEQNLTDVKTVRQNPRAIGSIFRRGFVRLWKLRGGGFYGLGWVICFFLLQFQALSDDVAEAQGIGDFASNWLVEKLLTFGVETFINIGLAFAWPGFFIDQLGGWGIAVLVAGFVLIDGKLRPLVLAQFPELATEKETAMKAEADRYPTPTNTDDSEATNDERR